MQLNLFCINELKRFEFAGKVYRLSNYLDLYKSDGSRIKCYVHDMQEEGFEEGSEDENTVYFKTEKERDDRLKFLNEFYDTDIRGNNIAGYYPVNIYIKDRPEIIQSFGDIFIYGILKIPRTLEDMQKLYKEKQSSVFLKKTPKKTGHKVKKQ